MITTSEQRSDVFLSVVVFTQKGFLSEKAICLKSWCLHGMVILLGDNLLRIEKSLDSLSMDFIRLEEAPSHLQERLKRAQAASKTLHDTLRWVPEMLQDAPGSLQDGTETAPGRPITFQDAPKTASDAFTTGQDRSKMAHMLPNDGPSHSMLVLTRATRKCSCDVLRH